MDAPDAAVADWLKPIISRIVEVAKPERIILFGSRARGTARPDSDVDLLIVKSTPSRRERRLWKIPSVASSPAA
jgi:predicted nucleotidyltransferase